MASSALQEGQMVTFAIDEVIETFEQLTTFTDSAQHYEPDPGSMQRSSETYWKPVQQAVNTVDGWDIDGQEEGILELSISGSLDVPTNVYKSLRADDLRDESSYRRAMKASALALAADMEADGLAKAATHGALCLASSETYGNGSGEKPVWDALAEAESRMFDAEMYTDMGTCGFLNARTYRAGGKSLVEGSANFSNSVPNEAYRNGEIQRQIAGIGDVYRHNKTYKFGAAAGTAVIAGGDVSILPEANESLANGSKGNVDNRFGTLTVDTTAGISVGDKFTFAGVKAVTLGSNKKELDYDQTFTVAAVTNATTLQVSPRPMAVEDAAMTGEKAPYANIQQKITNGSTLVWQNTTARDSNIIMAKDSMVIASSPIPYNHEMFRQLNCESFSVGPINGLIGFEAQLGKLTGQYRMAIWYDWQVERPEAVGVMLDNQS